MTSAAVPGTDHVRAIAEIAQRAGLRVSVAESLTSGQLCSALGSGPNASDWFAGGVIAYSRTVKHAVLGVTPGPVVTEQCAREMAIGVAHLLDADAAVATTGVGGPDPEEGCPPGTVHVATVVGGVERTAHLRLDGDPEEILEETVVRSLDLLRNSLEAAAAAVSGPPRPGTGSGAAPAG